MCKACLTHVVLSFREPFQGLSYTCCFMLLLVNIPRCFLILCCTSLKLSLMPDGSPPPLQGIVLYIVQCSGTILVGLMVWLVAGTWGHGQSYTCVVLVTGAWAQRLTHAWCFLLSPQGKVFVQRTDTHDAGGRSICSMHGHTLARSHACESSAFS